MSTRPQIRALCFDVFGTTVDWRSSIIAEGHDLGRQFGIERDWTAIADSWRGLYQPSMQRVRSGEIPWKTLDELHLESLEQLIIDFDLPLDDETKLAFNRAWHRLQPWPEVIQALNSLATRYTLATLSNANIALARNMGDHAGLPWHHILGAEVAKAYKPIPDAYLQSVSAMDLEPVQCMMVAAHNYDLRAASELGLATAFVARPTEYGPAQTTDLKADGPWDIVVSDFTGLAAAL